MTHTMFSVSTKQIPGLRTRLKNVCAPLMQTLMNLIVQCFHLWPLIFEPHCNYKGIC